MTPRTPNNVKRKDGIRGTGRKQFVIIMPWKMSGELLVKSSVLSWRLKFRPQAVRDMRDSRISGKD